MSTGWDSATLKKLKALTGKGLSTAEIGKRLGISKNAVVGKLNRMGWNATADTVAAKPVKSAIAKPLKKVAAKPMPKEKAKSEKSTVAKVIATKPTPAPKNQKSAISNQKSLAMHQRIIRHSLGMASLRHDQCRFPIGDPDSEDFHFCGEKVFPGKPYCYEHCKQVYQFVAPKKK